MNGVRKTVDFYTDINNAYRENTFTRNFTATADRLIEDADRRRTGDFYTPKIWADEAHKLITKHLGCNWYNDYMVWDCAWGTGNLTRDYKFDDLYCSTLIASDLALGRQYNSEAVKFQYDFLNDDVEAFEKIAEIKNKKGYLTEADFVAVSPKLYTAAPSLIRGLLTGKKILFLINPPYGTAGSMKKDKKRGIAVTTINKQMLAEGVGNCSQQLYAQFIYRICIFKQLFSVDMNILLFSNAAIVNSIGFKGLRQRCKGCNLFINDSFYFCADEFADCSKGWGVLCSYWSDATENLITVVKASIRKEIYVLGSKRLYNLDDKDSCMNWLKTFSSNKSKVCKDDSFTMSAGLTITDGSCSVCSDAYGYLIMSTNVVEYNTAYVCILPRKCKGHLMSYEICKDNFNKICVVFTARRLISGNCATWVNGKDEYMVPDTGHPKWQQFEVDSLVYCLFDNASNQASLRNIAYNSKRWDIKNEFFWLSRQQIKDLAQGVLSFDMINTDVEQDLINFGDDERFMHKTLQTYSTYLSSEAKKVLDKATELLVKSFKYRKPISTIHPEYHLNTWDMGYYQLNKLIKLVPELQSEWKEFRSLFKELGNKLRPLVYELGFLYK